MKSMKRAAIWAVSLLPLAVCGGTKKQIIQVDGISIYPAEWEKTKSELASRMRFDANCASPDLQFTLLAKSYRYPTEVGAEGCGMKIMYIREYIRIGLSGRLSPWYANTRTQGAPVPRSGDLSP